AWRRTKRTVKTVHGQFQIMAWVSGISACRWRSVIVLTLASDKKPASNSAAEGVDRVCNVCSRTFHDIGQLRRHRLSKRHFTKPIKQNR
ncbi:hypothetical protein BVRB_042870, partial [Beta vulgaris subsp. vulgaris]